MDAPSEDKIEVLDDIDNLNIGIPTDISGYGRNKDAKCVAAESSSTPEFICGIMKNCIADFDDFKSSPPFLVAFDNAERIIYLRTEVTYQVLDKGGDVDDRHIGEVKFYAKPGDKLKDYVPKMLGGPGSVGNWFPLNGDANINEWESALQKVYDYVKEGEERSARLMYAMLHTYRDEYAVGNRPSTILYYFTLYKNGQLDKKFEGKIHNPIATLPNINALNIK